MSVEFDSDPFIDNYYDDTDHMTVVGLACKRFLSNLCPSYRDSWPTASEPNAASERLKQLAQSQLFQRLRAGMTIEVNMLNPYCDYANQRAREERSINPDCRADIHRGIEALRCLAHDLRLVSHAEWRIEGKVAVWLLRVNPYVSYTSIRRLSGKPTLIRVGFLLFDRTGIASPRIRIQNEEGTIAAFEHHLGKLERDRLFIWGPRTLNFNDNYHKADCYNVFFCYNRQDKEQVLEIRQFLYQLGLICWLDQDALGGGDEWEKKIHAAIRKSPCAVVFYGTHGFGYWQVREIEFLRKREAQGDFKIIPVTLPKAPAGPEKMPLDNFQWMSLNNLEPPSLDPLVSVIREANGF